MRAIWYDVFREPPPGAPPADFRPLDQLLGEADFVSIHLNLNDSSRHIIGARELGLMRPSAYLVNMARGGVVDQAALTTALQEHRIAGTGLDCLDPEPPLATDSIVQLPNVIALPHIGDARDARGTRAYGCRQPRGGADRSAAARHRQPARARGPVLTACSHAQPAF